MITTENFTRVNNDVNGNPRYVIHFMKLNTLKDERVCENDGIDRISNLYNLAIERAKKAGGKKYRGKDFGGGIVFQSYNLPTLCKTLNEFLTVRLKP